MHKIFYVAFASLGLGCSAADTEGAGPDGSNVLTTGGASNSGGALPVASGGALTGGFAETGGAAPATGGTAEATGGVIESTGGSASTGGDAATGGVAETGGTTSTGGAPPTDPNWCKVGKKVCEVYSQTSWRGYYWSDSACTKELLPHLSKLVNADYDDRYTYCMNTQDSPTPQLEAPEVVFTDTKPYGGYYGYIWVDWGKTGACVKTLVSDVTASAGFLLPPDPPVSDPEAYAPQYCLEAP